MEPRVESDDHDHDQDDASEPLQANSSSVLTNRKNRSLSQRSDSQPSPTEDDHDDLDAQNMTPAEREIANSFHRQIETLKQSIAECAQSLQEQKKVTDELANARFDDAPPAVDASPDFKANMEREVDAILRTHPSMSRQDALRVLHEQKTQECVKLQEDRRQLEEAIESLAADVMRLQMLSEGLEREANQAITEHHHEHEHEHAHSHHTHEHTHARAHQHTTNTFTNSLYNWIDYIGLGALIPRH